MSAPSKAKLLARRAQLRAEEARARWRTDPVAFAEEALGVGLWDRQQAIACDVARYPLCSVRTGQKVGKTQLVACLALWWVYTRPTAFVILTSANYQQVKEQIWASLSKLHRGARIPIGGKLAVDPATGLSFPDGRRIIGITASSPERFQGYSGAELFICIDEASGFDDRLFEAALGNMGGALPDATAEEGQEIDPAEATGRVLLTGNPTQLTGLFAKTHREQLPGWRLHVISSLDSPNVRAGRRVIPGLANAAFVRMMRDNFGEESAAFKQRVLGEFAEQGSDSVIPLSALESAIANWSSDPELEPTALHVGVDPAGYGDDESVIMGRKGTHALKPAAYRKLGNVELAARVVDYLSAHRDPGQPVIIRVDVGGLGQGVADVLVPNLERDPLVRVERVNAGSASRYSTRFSNTRAELWWSLRRWLERGGTLPPDQRRDAELLACRYFHNAKLQIAIESKDDLRKRIHRSPDRADALALAVLGESPLEDGERLPHATAQQLRRVAKPWEGTRPGLDSAKPTTWHWKPGDGPLPKRW